MLWKCKTYSKPLSVNSPFTFLISPINFLLLNLDLLVKLSLQANISSHFQLNTLKSCVFQMVGFICVSAGLELVNTKTQKCVAFHSKNHLVGLINDADSNIVIL